MVLSHSFVASCGDRQLTDCISFLDRYIHIVARLSLYTYFKKSMWFPVLSIPLNCSSHYNRLINFMGEVINFKTLKIGVGIIGVFICLYIII